MSQFELETAFPEAEAITGIDEAGRGCLAGPVVTAAVTWLPAKICSYDFYHQLADSKTLSEPVREKLYPQIIAHADRVRVAILGPAIIDYLNILQATLHGFEMVAPDFHTKQPLLIDGNRKPKSLARAQTVVKGDGKHSSMAAAGILAKVTRDRLIRIAAGGDDPYGFCTHKGYATALHRNRLQELGPGPYHRKSFAPIKNQQPQSDQVAIALSERLAHATRPALTQLWREFQASYHQIPAEAARKLTAQFQASGLAILPTPDCRSSWSRSIGTT